MISREKYEKAVGKLKRKCWISHEICKELSRRNATLRQSNESLSDMIDQIKKKVNECNELVHSMEGESSSVSILL
jgi:predicted RNase H-like nuclease (RuvC/YqgF family)